MSSYQATGRANFGWARGKLKHDPMFMALLERQVLPDGATVMDLGCGRGLLAAWCLAAERMAQRGQWTASFAPPRGLKFRGVELMAREAACGNKALQPLYGSRVKLTNGDMRTADLGGVDVIAALDVLHYIPTTDQDQLLDRIRSALPRAASSSPGSATRRRACAFASANGSTAASRSSRGIA